MKITSAQSFVSFREGNEDKENDLLFEKYLYDYDHRPVRYATIENFDRYFNEKYFLTISNGVCKWKI